MSRAALLGLALLVLAVAAAARADEALGPCADDAAKHCANLPGHGEKMKCLSAHESQLSPGCKERLAAVKKRVEEMKAEIEKACGADGAKLCPNRKLGAGLMPCLMEQEKQLSGACRDWLAAHREKPGAAK